MILDTSQAVVTRHPLAIGHAVGAMTALALVLAATSSAYGYHRDELYFRMLPPAWGYTDQPPLTPLLAKAAVGLFGDSVVGLRILALVCAAASVLILTLVTREVGGTRVAQALTAWGMAGASLTLLFGHVLLTASLDLVVWPAALLFTIRAVLRADGRWWLAAGAVIGASTFNKLLGVILMIGIAVGLAVCGPRRWFLSGWLWGGVGLAGLLAVPNVIYQAAHGWPQFAMGAALAQNNADEVRILVGPMLILLVGPVLAVFWIAGLVGLFRRPLWHPLRFLSVTFAVVVLFVFIAGTQFYYTAGVLAVLTAMGSVLVAGWARTRRRRTVVAVLLGVNAVSCAIASLPVLPVQVFGATGLAAINSAAADQVGWERYAEQVTDAAASVRADAIITSNYGEAGALDRFGVGLPPVVSGHNALGDLGPPAADAQTVLLVGWQGRGMQRWFEECALVDTLENGVGVDNEEQGAPVMVCTGPLEPWDELWERFRHLD
ncbi:MULTISPECIES: glycosyltransferase family 39 protein [unclassified Microbacterium]|uniref:ArnT family glycosyltransferase n=1 Tax=unclassified Microbacterium TaxID=2609290 RepID=UPI00214C6598|nr:MULTISPECIES: glycosyltransferase family 39 protein [unclassified Microbacterium]MCR2809429.1 glycosyltransferase family 39 protein [Microbacterium sp. zg.B185]WIM20564.1 glycosyltransferase family 39 protein [Microbacterium sp. zg-B185]